MEEPQKPDKRTYAREYMRKKHGFKPRVPSAYGKHDTPAEYQKAYRAVNAERIKQQRQVQVKCVCGAYVTKSHVARHFQSKKHTDTLAVDEPPK